MKKRSSSIFLRGLVGFLALASVAGRCEAQRPVVQPLQRAMVKTYQECVSSGGKISKEAGHATCLSNEGVLFVESADPLEKACRDKCGDGVCQEIVCMAVGCPCAETPQSCPKDCK